MSEAVERQRGFDKSLSSFGKYVIRFCLQSTCILPCPTNIFIILFMALWKVVRAV